MKNLKIYFSQSQEVKKIFTQFLDDILERKTNQIELSKEEEKKLVLF